MRPSAARIVSFFNLQHLDMVGLGQNMSLLLDMMQIGGVCRKAAAVSRPQQVSAAGAGVWWGSSAQLCEVVAMTPLKRRGDSVSESSGDQSQVIATEGQIGI